MRARGSDRDRVSQHCIHFATGCALRLAAAPLPSLAMRHAPLGPAQPLVRPNSASAILHSNSPFLLSFNSNLAFRYATLFSADARDY